MTDVVVLTQSQMRRIARYARKRGHVPYSWESQGQFAARALSYLQGDPKIAKILGRSRVRRAGKALLWTVRIGATLVGLASH